MTKVVPESDEQAIQHFLSNSNWDEMSVLDQVVLEADRHLGGKADSALLIDESGFTKKGDGTLQSALGRAVSDARNGCSLRKYHSFIISFG